jgi:hypothetical protein
MKKTVTRIGLALLIISGVAFLFVRFAKFTVSSGEKIDGFTGVRYGYKLEQYYFRRGFRFSLWNAQAMVQEYDLSALTVEKATEERWLSNDGAIFLNLEIKYHDSVPSLHPVKIIYDFQRGELYTLSGLTLWRTWNRKEPIDKNWMTDSEFQAVLTRLEH